MKITKKKIEEIKLIENIFYWGLCRISLCPPPPLPHYDSLACSMHTCVSSTYQGRMWSSPLKSLPYKSFYWFFFLLPIIEVFNYVLQYLDYVASWFRLLFKSESRLFWKFWVLHGVQMDRCYIVSRSCNYLFDFYVGQNAWVKLWTWMVFAICGFNHTFMSYKKEMNRLTYSKTW